MRTFSELSAEASANEYEEMLLDAICLYEEFDNGSHAVIKFCKKYIYPSYRTYLGDAWRLESTADEIKINNFFKNI